VNKYFVKLLLFGSLWHFGGRVAVKWNPEENVIISVVRIMPDSARLDFPKTERIGFTSLLLYVTPDGSSPLALT